MLIYKIRKFWIINLGGMKRKLGDEVSLRRKFWIILSENGAEFELLILDYILKGMKRN